MMGVVLIWVFAYFSFFFFFFEGQEQKVFHTVCNSKKSHCTDKNISEQPDSRSTSQSSEPTTSSSGWEGRAFSKSNAKRSQIAPRRPLLPAPRFYTRLPALQPPAGEESWLAFSVLGSSVRGLLPKPTQRTPSPLSFYRTGETERPGESKRSNRRQRKTRRCGQKEPKE